MAMIAALPTQARFFFLLLPRLVAGRCTPSRLAGYAIELTARGSRRLGMWCWERAVRQSTRDVRMCDAVLDLCIQAGHQEAAEEFANRFYDTNGMSPAAAVKLTGNLVLTGAYGPALKVYDRLLEHCGDDLADRSPAPAWDDSLTGQQLRALIGARAGVTAMPAGGAAELESAFARLCFSFAAFETSARLFEQAASRSHLGPKEQIAWAYALSRCGRVEEFAGELDVADTSPEAASLDPDWLVLLASVHFASGATPAAADAIQAALRARLGDHADLEPMIADCLQILTSVSRVPDVISFSTGPVTKPSSEKPGIRKIFVCGSGWSGSGAIYDALSEYDGLAEAPNTPIDCYTNVGTDNEMMFVQGPAGLGRLWRKAKGELQLSRLDLWDMFRVHVLSGGAIGYSEHKSGRVALNLILHFGHCYTMVFRKACESLSRLPAPSMIARLHSIFADMTEALSGMIADSVGGHESCNSIIYNNAIFGPNIDMLEIFGNARAVFVVRDPLDQFADRRANDLKHWMSANLFIRFYRGTRDAFRTRVAMLPPELAREVYKVEFERFVLDAQYRKETIESLLDGQQVTKTLCRFDPGRSERNIGIYAKLLAPGEREVLEAELKHWRRT